MWQTTTFFGSSKYLGLAQTLHGEKPLPPTDASYCVKILKDGGY